VEQWYVSQQVSIEVTLVGMLDACGVSAQYRAASKFDEHLSFDEVEGCDACDGDEIIISDIIDLDSTTCEQVVNPFT